MNIDSKNFIQQKLYSKNNRTVTRDVSAHPREHNHTQLYTCMSLIILLEEGIRIQTEHNEPGLWYLTK